MVAEKCMKLFPSLLKTRFCCIRISSQCVGSKAGCVVYSRESSDSSKNGKIQII